LINEPMFIIMLTSRGTYIELYEPLSVHLLK
jgi:hypothetical protein